MDKPDLIAAARQVFECYDQGFACPVRPDIAMRDLMLALQALPDSPRIVPAALLGEAAKAIKVMEYDMEMGFGGGLHYLALAARLKAYAEGDRA